jgi:hypothetical protein
MRRVFFASISDAASALLRFGLDGVPMISVSLSNASLGSRFRLRLPPLSSNMASYDIEHSPPSVLQLASPRL